MSRVKLCAAAPSHCQCNTDLHSASFSARLAKKGRKRAERTNTIPAPEPARSAHFRCKFSDFPPRPPRADHRSRSARESALSPKVAKSYTPQSTHEMQKQTRRKTAAFRTLNGRARPASGRRKSARTDSQGVAEGAISKTARGARAQISAVSLSLVWHFGENVQSQKN